MIDASIFECFKKTPLSPIFIREIGARVNVGLKKQRWSPCNWWVPWGCALSV